MDRIRHGLCLLFILLLVILPSAVYGETIPEEQPGWAGNVAERGDPADPSEEKEAIDLSLLQSEENTQAVEEKAGPGTEAEDSFRPVSGAERERSVTADVRRLDLGVGESRTVKVTVSPAGSVSWRSLDPSVASVSSSGKVRALSLGTASVLAESGGSAWEVQTVVHPAPSVIRLDRSSITMGVGEEWKLGVYFSGDEYGSVSWSSSSKAVSVDADGYVYAKKTGTAKVTAKTYNGKKATCRITVKKAVTSIRFLPGTIVMGEGETRQATIELMPKGSATCRLVWNTDYRAAATVDENGVITAHRADTGNAAVISVIAANGIRAEGSLWVYLAPAYLILGEHEVTCSVGMSGNMDLSRRSASSGIAGGAVTYLSGDPSILTVSQTGEYKAKKAGTTYIAATAYNGVRDECFVTVLPAPTRVNVSPKTLYLAVGENAKLTASVPDGTPAEYEWSSSGKQLGTGRDCTVTGKKVGTVTVTVKTQNGKKDTCTVKVKKAPTSVDWSCGNDFSWGVGESRKPSVGFLPAGADCNERSWSSSAPSVIAYDPLTGCLKAKSAGTATVTLTVFGGLSRSRTVRVYSAPTRIEPSLPELTLSVGMSDTLVYRLFGGSETAGGSVTFSTSGKDRASVSSFGQITAKKAGECIITLTAYNGVKASVPVRVVKAPSGITLDRTSLRLNTSLNTETVLSASVQPAGTPADVIWSSSDTSVVSVEPDGTVRALKNGTATVSVKTHNGRKATCRVTVGPVCRALLIGETYPVTDYQTGETKDSLLSARNDVDAMEAFLGSMTASNWSVSKKHNASKTVVLSMIRSTFRNATADDVCLLMLAGHGGLPGVFVCSDSEPLTPSELRSVMDEIPGGGDKIVIVDCCYSGAFIEKGEGSFRPEDLTEAFCRAFAFQEKDNSLASKGYYVLTACTSDQVSYGGDYSSGTSQFVYPMLAGCGYDTWKEPYFFTGKYPADTNKDGKFSLKEVYAVCSKTFDGFSGPSKAQVYPEKSDFILWERK